MYIRDRTAIFNLKKNCATSGQGCLGMPLMPGIAGIADLHRLIKLGGSEAGCYVSPVASSVLSASTCHPDLCLKQSLTLNPPNVCFSYYVKLFTLCLFCLTGCPTYVTCFAVTRWTFMLRLLVLDFDSGMWFSILEPAGIDWFVFFFMWRWDHL